MGEQENGVWSVGVLLLLLFDVRCSLFVVRCLMWLFAAARGAVFAVRALSVNLPNAGCSLSFFFVLPGFIFFLLMV